MATRRMIMKPKRLECELQQLNTWSSLGIEPDCWELEQYSTPPHIAANILATIEQEHGDIYEKNVVDLGCGCGVLSIGCALLGAKSVQSVDIDRKSLDIIKDNVLSIGIEEVVSVVEGDVSDLDPSLLAPANVVIMNPPFGTKDRAGMDKVFVQTALRIAPIAYSLHKLSTRKYWTKPKVSKELGCVVEPILEIRFNIDRTFRHHMDNSVDIDVDLIKFTRNK